MGVQYFKALADETRLRLANLLLRHELSVNELVQILKMGQSRVSRHLKIMLEAGLLVSRRDGLWVFYQTPDGGRARNFLESSLPFVSPDPHFKNDLDLAQRITQARIERTRRFFDSVAEHWEELKREALGDFDISAAILEVLPKDCRMAADLGCGSGSVLGALLDRACAVIGVDGSPKMLEICKRRFGAQKSQTMPLSLRIGELSHLPLADNEADFACLNLVLHHLPDPFASLVEVRRIMAPDGTLFLSEFLRHDDETMRLRYGDYWLGFEEAELCAYLDRAGFRLQSMRQCPVKNGHNLLLLTARACAPSYRSEHDQGTGSHSSL